MGRVSGKVAFITGAARGLGRSHAVRLAEEGADIVAVDVLEDVETVGYPLSTAADAEETVKLVEALDRRIIFEQADVRDLARLTDAAQRGVEEFGHVDIVCANAGICGAGRSWELDEQSWQTMIDINLTGVWKTVRATAPLMIERGAGGSIVLVSSIAGLGAMPNLVHYDASKHGVVGVMRACAVELAQFGIRVNTVHPTNVDTPMLQNAMIRELMTGDPNASQEQVVVPMSAMHAMNLPWVETIDISNAVLWLASDESRYVTGTTQVVDAGAIAPFKLGH
jgi:SDR family mycofactocin-dependent oxidoreductase